MPTILIADDEFHIRRLIQQTLELFEDEGVEIITAQNGEEALNIIKEKRPELVFLDIVMPEIDGFSVCITVKKELGMKDVHIAILTAMGQECDKAMGKLCGCDDFITKPFSTKELRTKVREILFPAKK
ncbi:response regulator transcription factor [Candidatus Magnetominusculus xianensis]|uniref:Two-component system response regulator n=1 Tax=Candidatus Magnetominusculus xianensis TaxID=1748249 RepID=A0ABR5SCI7_9BACT|nr:response regulator [Candidatus Magnetominusculus xianensis]KWT81178.1 two-component system response regulator [Candidatus Magnetominusculus xianensis]MBF0404308.1 response regulator [Nitrospirota bacterium]